MDVNSLLRGIFLIHIIDRGPWITHAKDKGKEKNSFQELNTCLEGVFHTPVPSEPPIPGSTPHPVPSTTTPAPIPRCIYTDGDGNPEVWLPEHGRVKRSSQGYDISGTSARCMNTDDSPQPEQHRRRRSTQLVELSRFQRCICHHPHQKCPFSLMETDYNITTLVHFFGEPMYTHRAILTYQQNEYQCRVHDDFIVYCRTKLYYLPEDAYDKGFQQILDCLSTALALHICEPEETTAVNGAGGPTTARNPLSIESAGISSVEFIILILGCVLCVLLGITGTICGVICCRKMQRRKRYQEPRVVYSTADERVHADLTDAELELLNQRSGSPDIINSSPEHDKPSRILNSTTLGSLFNIAAASDGYEPVRNAENNHYEEIPSKDDNYEPLLDKTIRDAKPENTYSPMKSTRHRGLKNVNSPAHSEAAHLTPESESKRESKLRYRRNSR